MSRKTITDLPKELVDEVVSHLESASSVINLSLTNKDLYQKVSEGDYRVFRAFVAKQFPSINLPPFAKDVAIALTSRSRAWAMSAFIGRVITAPSSRSQSDQPPAASQTLGYVPMIDSYEYWDGGRWSDRKEVLAWAAGPKVALRYDYDHKKDSARTINPLVSAGSSELVHDNEFTSSYNYWSNDTTMYVGYTEDQHASAQADILDLHLLKPHQRRKPLTEHLIVRRADGKISSLVFDHGAKKFESTTIINSSEPAIDCTAMNSASDPLLAVSYRGRRTEIRSIHAPRENHDPVCIQITSPIEHYRNRCVKFLTDTRLASGLQVEGANVNVGVGPVLVYDIMPDGSDRGSVLLDRFRPNEGETGMKSNANTIAPLDASACTGGSRGDIFLSGWSDGCVRLHDLRTNGTPLNFSYTDTADDGQILSLLPVGQERFFAGGHHNAVLKVFSLRMPRSDHFSCLAAPRLGDRRPTQKRLGSRTSWLRCLDMDEINTFLAIHMNTRTRLYEPNRPSFRGGHRQRLERYNGSIYSLSSPSSASPTIYAGIENHIIQLDFACTDDVLYRNAKWYEDYLRLDKQNDQILNLSCYQRPREEPNGFSEGGGSSAGAPKLRNQINWYWETREEIEPEDGWDERWLLAGKSGGLWR